MDIDIDTPSYFDPSTVFPEAIPASISTNGKFKRHPAGVYYQQVPRDPELNISSVPYNIAPAFGLFKVDLLHLYLLDSIEDKATLRRYANTDPDWSLLQDDNVVETLFQMSNHGDVLRYLQPTDVQTLADCVALIRPGRRYVLDTYKGNVQAARKELYKSPLPKGCFKKAHAIAYALNIVVQLHTITDARRGFCEF